MSRGRQLRQRVGLGQGGEVLLADRADRALGGVGARHRDAVDDVERLRAPGVHRVHAADLQADATAGRAVALGDLHAGDGALQALLQAAHRQLVHLLGLHRGDRAGEVALPGGAVAHRHDLLQLHRLGAQREVGGGGLSRVDRHAHGLRAVADQAGPDLARAGGDVGEQEAPVVARERPAIGAHHHHVGARERALGARVYHPPHDAARGGLGAGRTCPEQEAEQRAYRRCTAGQSHGQHPPQGEA